MSDTFEFDDKSRVERLVGTLHDPGATVGDVLTVQAGGGIAAAPGGGSGGVQVVTVPVSSAQILALATPFVLVPGQANHTPVVFASSILYQAGPTPYTDNGGDIRIDSALAGSPLGLGWLILGGAGFWNLSDDQINGGIAGTSVVSGVTSGFAGADIVVYADNNPTGGDGTLLVTLAYFLVPTV